MSIETVLDRLEEGRKEFWNVAKEGANFMNMLIKSCRYKRALELGTSNGYSAIWLAQALKQTGGHLTTIEFWAKRLVLARENFEKCALSKYITPICSSASLALENLAKEGKTFDFVFIDANKLEYLTYFKLIDPMLEPGGVIVADNITSHPEKVRPFVEAIESDKSYQTQLINFDGGLLVALKLEQSAL